MRAFLFLTAPPLWRQGLTYVALPGLKLRALPTPASLTVVCGNPEAEPAPWSMRCPRSTFQTPVF